ncbi:MAG: hypothetical protein LPK46_08220 [Bacteroidota bacterium]|nr:hypothetical protein [Bacteroidota bacterium]MDX5506109.1 hypothetical protein [Bacteroidota bacterium]
MNDPMNEERSFEVIREMIQRTRYNLVDDVFYYLFWGWLVLGAGMIQLALILMDNPYNYLPWIILMPIGGLVTFFYSRKKDQGKRHTTLVDKAMMYVWTGFLVVLLLTLVLSVHAGWSLTYVYVMGLYGLGTFITGGMLNFKPLVIGGILSWVMAGIGFFLVSSDFIYMLILLLISITVSYLIPGYLLKKQGKHEV